MIKSGQKTAEQGVKIFTQTISCLYPVEEEGKLENSYGRIHSLRSNQYIQDTSRGARDDGSWTEAIPFY